MKTATSTRWRSARNKRFGDPHQPRAAGEAAGGSLGRSAAHVQKALDEYAKMWPVEVTL